MKDIFTIKQKQVRSADSSHQHNKVTGLMLRAAPSFVILIRLSFGHLAPIMMNNGVFVC